MINDIISAVGVALNREFGDGYSIYSEAVERDAREPCFFIQCVRSSLERQLDVRFYRENMFCLQYFPADKLEPVSECRETAERLLLCLGYIVVNGGLRRGTKMNYEISDGILRFFVNYDSFARVEENVEKQKMSKVEQTTVLRSGRGETVCGDE